uniref:energy transducer TonB n=1 Tax=uncultured Draconibacterium sp. TaxID=1573823 RepID=UPI0032168FA1
MRVLKLLVPALFLITVFCLNVDAQEKSKKEGDVFFIVEEMPEFPGGQEALRKFIANNIKYPEVAQKNGIQGRVYITFVVAEDGSICQARVARGVDPSLDKEALRVVNAQPKWSPGKQKGKAVKVSYTVPINFALGSGASSGKSKSVSEKKEGDVFFIVEEMPEFPGGEQALREFISQNIKYPEDAKKNGIQGRVYITFVVAEDGFICQTIVARGVDPSLDKEALRVVNAQPKWKPGKQKGKAVKVSYTVPIIFTLGDDKKS